MDWSKLNEILQETDHSKFPELFIPEDQPPMNNWVGILALIIMVSGIVGSVIYNVGMLLFAITIVLFILMLDSTLQLNYQIRSNGMAKADYLVALGVGGLVVFINMAIGTTYFSPIRFPVSILVAGMTFSVYELLLLTVVRANLDTDAVYVEKHPERPLDRYYIFTEEKYIPLLEESAKQSASTDE